MARIRRSRIVVAALAAAAAACGVLAVAGRIGSGDARAAGTSVSGRVFVDYNSNGIRNLGTATNEATDAGVAGATVQAYDSVGTLVGTATSAADGTYTVLVSGAATDQLRIEFSTPSGFEPSFVATGSTTDNNSSVQFVTDGATGVDYGVANASEYCQDNPDLVSCVLPNVDSMTTTPTQSGGVLMPSTLVQPLSWTWTGDYSGAYPGADLSPQNIAESSRLGSVFGIGAGRDRNVYFGTYVKRHAPYGPAGATNTIYRRYLGAGGQASVQPFITLPGTLPAHAAANPAPIGGAYPDYAADGHLGLNPGDVGYSSVFRNVGRVGLGDVDVTPDGQTLLAVDMDESAPKLYKIPLSGSGDSVTAGSPQAIPIPRPTTSNGQSCNGTWHPMGIGVRGDRILVGGVCGADDTVSSTPVSGNVSPTTPAYQADSRVGRIVNGRTTSNAFVQELSGTTFSTVLGLPLDPPRNGNSVTPQPIGSSSGLWTAWADDSVAGWTAPSTITPVLPQAMLSNIEIADDGSLAISLRDRWLDMNSPGGTLAYWPNISSGFGFGGYGAGDLVRACPDGSGALQLENAGSCGSTTGSPVPFYNGGYGGKSFYWQGYYDDGSTHPENAIGGTASMPGNRTVWSTAYDISDFDQQGVLSLGFCPQASSGSRACGPASGGIGSQTSGAILTTASSVFKKGNGLADLELLCDKAPVQIGNRLWIDADKDGIQDPGEKVLAGVTVRLYDSGGTLVGTAITDSEGRYYFSSTLDKPAAGDGTSQGGGLKPDADFVVRLDNPADYAPGGPLAGYSLTVRDAGSDNAINSKAAAAGSGAFGKGSFPEMRISSRRPGENNHTFDAGFVEGAGPSPGPGGAVAPRLVVSVGGCIHAHGTRTVRLSVRNPNSVAMTSRRMTFTVPKGFRVVGASRGYSVRKGTVTWKSGTIAAGKTEKLYVKLKATGRAGTGSRLVVGASGTVSGTAVKAARRAWAKVCARPSFTG